MTKSRRSTYNRNWFSREAKVDKRKRRKEYNRKIRRAPLEYGCNRKAMRNMAELYWDTVS